MSDNGVIGVKVKADDGIRQETQDEHGHQEYRERQSHAGRRVIDSITPAHPLQAISKTASRTFVEVPRAIARVRVPPSILCQQVRDARAMRHDILGCASVVIFSSAAELAQTFVNSLRGHSGRILCICRGELVGRGPDLLICRRPVGEAQGKRGLSWAPQSSAGRSRGISDKSAQANCA